MKVIYPKKVTKDGVLITPKLAKDLLENNASPNRNISKAKVDAWAASMRRGEFVDSSETIKIDQYGRLMDGQHRLTACVQSGISFYATVSYGVPYEIAVNTIDIGHRRTPGAILQINGFKNPQDLASAVKWMLAMEDKSLIPSRWGTKSVSAPLLVSTASEHPELQAIVRWLIKLRMGGITQATGAFAALCYRFKKVDAKSAKNFFERLADGSSLERGHPILVLRDRLMRERAQKLHGGLPLWQKIKLAIYAWNAYREGRTVTKFLLRDKFPVIR